jgi:hypothetical protein
MRSIAAFISVTVLAIALISPANAFKWGSNPTAAAAPFALAASPSTAKGVTRFADGSLGVVSCSNYNPGTRQCSGGTDIAYGGVYAIQNASNAAAATDVIQIRSFNGTYIGTDELGSIKVRGGTSRSRFQLRGYQNEIPRLRSVVGPDFVHINQVLFDPMPNNRDVICIAPRIGWRVENSEIRNCGAGGINSWGNFEFINLNVHHTGFNSTHCGVPAGKGQCHGLYADNSPQSGGTITAVIDGGEYHHNEGWGIHCYAHCTNVIIGNVKAYANHSGAGIGALNDASNANVIIYNALAYDNAGGITASAGGILVYNVTVVNNRDSGLVHGMLGTVRNSIILGGYTTKTFHFGTGAFLGNSNSFNNITTGTASSLFVDPAKGNFQPVSSIRVKGIGADLAQRAQTSTVK